MKDLVKTEKSKEKELIIRGKVNGEPIKTFFGGEIGWHEIKFSMLLETDVVADFKKSGMSTIKAGSTLVAVVSGHRSPCYVRNEDEVELKGRLMKVFLSSGIECYYIDSERLFNETLQFSFDY